jgi:putative transposase
MLKGMKFQLDLNEKQETIMLKHVGCCRWVYNDALAKVKEYHQKYGEFLPMFIFSAKLPELKVTYPWLREVDSNCLQQVLSDQHQAFQNFFKHGRGFPKFKSKHRDRQSFRIPNRNNSTAIRFQGKQIRIGKIGFVNISRANKQLKRLPLKYKIKSATVSKDSDQHWYVSVLIECENQIHLPKLNNIIGIDLGIKNNYETCYLNDVLEYCTIDNPKSFEKKSRKLQKLQMQLSRKKKGSMNREKAKHKVAKMHFKIKSIRKNFNHQLSKFLILNFQMIVIEDLDLEQMKKNRFGREVSDLAFYQFRTFLDYKSKWYGRELIVSDRYFASTKICAECGFKNMNLTLKDRSYVCPNCNEVLDRDKNASKNLYQLGAHFWNTGELLDSSKYTNLFQQN